MIEAVFQSDPSARGARRTQLGVSDAPMLVDEQSLTRCSFDGPLKRPGAALEPNQEERVEIILQLSGAATVTSCGQDYRLTPGLWTTWSAHRALSLVSDGVSEELVLRLPAAAVFQQGDLSTRCAQKPYGGGAGVARLVASYLTCMADDIDEMSSNCRAEIIATASHLVHIAVQEGLAAKRTEPMLDIFRRRIEAYIDRHLRDPDLSIDKISLALHCSKRYLHVAFRQGGETINHSIWARRLERCWRELGDPTTSHRSITEIAFSWGFNNAAHFSRLFKTRYGVSPSQHRTSALAANRWTDVRSVA